MNDEIKHDGINMGIFIGEKEDSGEIKDVTKGFKVHSWGVMVRFSKVFDGPNILIGQRGVGWALNWFLELKGKELFNLHYLNIKNGEMPDGDWKSFVEAEYYMTGLTSEDDVERWVKDRIEHYCGLPVLCGGYQYYQVSASWDSAEMVGKISIS